MMCTTRKDASSPDFDTIFKKFMTNIIEVHNVPEISKKFTNEKDNHELVKEATILLDEWDLLPAYLTPINNSKDDIKSAVFRTKGNALYINKQLKLALHMYNTSIRYAKHPLIASSQGDYLSLAFGYANRSAILYELNLFELAMDDMHRSKQYGYPEEKLLKLVMRLVKCIVHEQLTKLEDNNKFFYENNEKEVIINAMHELVVTMVKNLRNYKLTDKNLQLLLTDVLGIVNEYINGTRKGGSQPNNVLPQCKFPQSTPYPSVEHSYIKGLSNKVSLVELPGRGRCMVATEDIYPGEINVVLG